MCATCTPAERGPFAGASDPWKNGPPPAAVSTALPPAAWEAYAAAQAWPVSNAAPFTSRGHQPEQQVDVRANELARPAYAALVADTVFPDGSVLLEQAHSGTNEGFGYAMRKQNQRWTFVQLDARGAVLESGTLTLCAGCHAQAPADQVFGPPRGP